MPVVGVDIGTQSLKVVVVDDALAALGTAATAYGVDHPRPGWVQQDPVVWEEALAPTVAAALERAGVRPDEVRGVGVAGQLDGCVAVGEGGLAIGPCLIWMDKRAEVPPLPDDVRSRTGVTADPSHMGPKVRWLLTRAAGMERARFHQPVSYLVERLTGAFVFDHGLASTTMMYALASRDLEPDLCAPFGVDRARLPAVAEASSAAGSLTAEGARLSGLPVGTPVAVGTGDDFATPLGAGIVRPGPAVCVLGTAEVVGALCDRAAIHPDGLVQTHGYVTPGTYFIENPGWLAGGAVAWARRLLGAADDQELYAWAAAAPPGSGGVTFLPALAGAMAPEWNAGARGCFYGLTAAHERGHLARAVLEGCAFAMRDVVDRLVALGVPADPVVLVGGGSRSRVWAQIRADLLGRPVEVSRVADACPLGAALLGAVAAGVTSDLAGAAARVAGARDAIDHDPKAKRAMDDAYGRYRALFDALRPLFD